MPGNSDPLRQFARGVVSENFKTSMLSIALLGATFYGLISVLGYESTISDIGSRLMQVASQLMYRLLL